ncbi:MAG: amidohydrolase family protein, partial [bacterium]
MNQRIKISLYIFAFFTTSFTISCQTQIPIHADLVLTNGKIRTVDKTQPEAQAMAIWQDRFLAVGSDTEIDALIGNGTTVIDLQGKLALPGFIDNHTHFLSGGQWLAGVKLKDAKDEQEFGERLAAKSKELPAGAWILEGTWDHDNWSGGKLPTAE